MAALAAQPPNLKHVRVAVLYENVTHGALIGRSVDEMMSLLRETGAQFIFRGFWRWVPCPETYDQAPPTLREKYRRHGYSYANLQQTIAKIKAASPHIIFCGAIPAQIIQRWGVWNPITGKIYRYPETWQLAFDPAKLGLPISKERIQYAIGRRHFWVPQGMRPDEYDPAKAAAYLPDLTNPEVQELLTSWAEKQIECGADAIWIDALYWTAAVALRTAGSADHPAVRTIWQAAAKLIASIREAGKRHGRNVLVGTWAAAWARPDRPAPPNPGLDFVTVTPSVAEVKAMHMDEERWRERIALIRKRLGDIPIFAFLDWSGTTNTPLGQFSQRLTPEQQRKFLEIADSFFSKLGVVFIYPLHGGYMGLDATKLAFGKFHFYDSLAPEFNTYPTILKLARAKAGRAPKR